ncbi:hypothetical protein [Saccharopolyspora spinosa]|uniref:hypothetical protein n=1 Tax=Saccharopolyspora spinosa TaxID=60894 RepID=UPI0016592E73|nr:hypothetical protein [Saccharopolyspora spinosa]
MDEWDLDGDELGDGGRAEPGSRGRGGAKPLDEHSAGAFAGVAVALAKASRSAAVSVMTASGGGRVSVQEGQGDVAVQAGEHDLAAGPVPGQQRGELLDRADAALDVADALPVNA